MAGAVFKRRDMSTIAARERLNKAEGFSNDEENRRRLLAFPEFVFFLFERVHVNLFVFDEANLIEV